MSLIECAKGELLHLKGRPRFEIMTEATGIITALLKQKNILPIIVGGLAVEIYTRNEYTTVDIDLVLDGREVANDLLLELDFEKEGRYWYHPVLGISVEIPGSALEDADHDKVIKLNLPSGKHVYVIGIEDIILDRLRACVHWRSTSDCEWGVRMYKTHVNKLDIDYMRKQAVYDLTIEQLEDWISQDNKPFNR